MNDHGTATATTTAGTGDVAFAFGNDASANATLGNDDFALADGTDAFAASGGSAGSNYDSAIDIGSNTGGNATIPGGAYSGAGSFVNEPGTGSNDFALDMGNNNGVYDGVSAVDARTTAPPISAT